MIDDDDGVGSPFSPAGTTAAAPTLKGGSGSGTQTAGRFVGTGSYVVTTTPRDVQIAITKLVCFIFFHVVALSSTGAAVSKFTLYLMDENSSSASYLIGAIGIVSRFLNFGSNPFYGIMSDRVGMGRKRFMLMSVTSVTIEMLLLGVFGSVPMLVIAGLIRGSFDCTITISSAAMMDLSSSPDVYSKNFVYISVAGACGIVIGPLVGALVGMSDSLILPFFVSACIEGCNILFLIFVVPETTTFVLPPPEPNTAPASPASVESTKSQSHASDELTAAANAIANAVNTKTSDIEITASSDNHSSATAATVSAAGAGGSAASTSIMKHARPNSRPASSAAVYGTTSDSSSVRLAASRNAATWTQIMNPLNTFKIIFATPRLTRLAVAVFCILMSFQVANIFWLFTSHVFGWTTTQNNLFLGALGVLGVFAQVVLLPISLRRFGDDATLLLAGGSQTMCYLLFSLTTSAPMMWMDLFVSMFGAVALPACRAELSKEISKSCQGQLQGAMSALMTVGGMIGTLLMTSSFGFFVRRDNALGVYAPNAPFIFGCLINALAVLAMWYAIHHPRATVPVEFVPSNDTDGDSSSTTYAPVATSEPDELASSPPAQVPPRASNLV